MSVLTPASEMILRHSNEFTERRVLFAGDWQDTLPAQFIAATVLAHTNQYHHWQLLKPILEDKVTFSFSADKKSVADCNTLIYFWPKNKQEAQFQLSNLLALFPVGSDIFIVGENRSGVRSAENKLWEMLELSKIDSARRCSLYYGRLDKKIKHDNAIWWGHYHVGTRIIKTLPGVFSRDGLDPGSQLLLSSFTEQVKGKVLDIACGTGVLACVLAHHSPQIKLTLSDVSAAALEASRATLAINNIDAEVIASNLYSDIKGRFDLIMANPPFHDGLAISLHIAERLIRGAYDHLRIGGKLRIVANAFLPYPALLDAVFGSHQVLAQNSRFKVYQAELSHQRDLSSHRA
ncbi:16S rRNA (guanine(1207)-N(2))-methyltransferase RsmC [Candidatus Regiella endosymbiont of Tuberolachnus salignus]|uniref:16S rRNA (guanine(1207)-N(2))-methyltransferase RsmC n=1 Tax=Candidatus Regiella endosymbiont of Tuberolachnus salignus TaxID=3077956 RepID=UPI0030CC6471